MRFGLCAVLCVGCGRIAFDSTSDLSTYELTVGRLGHSDAAAACASTGGHLATVADAGENAEIETFAATIPIDPGDTQTTNHQSILWLGAHATGDARVLGNWGWDTGEPMTFTNWRAGEPDTAMERCLIMLGREHGLWDNRACDEMFAFLCETD